MRHSWLYRLKAFFDAGAAVLLGAFALAWALAACEGRSPSGEHQNVGVLGQALGEGGASGSGDGLPSDTGEPTVEDQADPTVVLVESKLATSGMTDWSKFGSKLAISGDVLVSVAPEAVINGDLGRGAAYVFQRDAGTSDWRETKQLLPHDDLDFRNFGQHLAVDGQTIAVAVPTTRSWNGFASQTAGVYLFGRDEGGPDMWGAILKVTDPIVEDYVDPIGNPYARGDFATSIALSGDLLAVGAVSSGAEGMVMIFERHLGGPNNWGKLATILESDLGDARGSDEAFGQAVALDGDNLLIGAPPDRNTSEEGDFSWTNNNGAAFVFRRDAVERARFTYVTRLESTAAPGEYDAFGLQVALAGGTAIIGAPGGSGGFLSENPGAVYIFNQDQVNRDSWQQTAGLTASDASVFDLFGNSLAIAGDALLIGAPGKSIGFNSNQGRAYLFQRNAASSSVWEQTSMLTASDGQEHDAFGTAVATDGERSVVGAPDRAGDAAPPAVHWFGAVYVYQPEEPAPPPPVVCEPAFPAIATLDDFGSFESTSGLLLATAPGTLLAPLPIWVFETLPPPEPLYSGATPLGPYYSIGAECTTAAPVATPFIVGVPVPEGADIEHLAVAVLVSGSSVLDAHSTARAWQRLTGIYDPIRRLLLVTLGTLDAGGNTLVLTEDQSVESARVASADRTGVEIPRFIVECKGMDPLLCREEDKAKIERLLVDAYRSYKREGFADPALQNAIPDLGPADSEPRPSFELSYMFVGITIEPQDAGHCTRTVKGAVVKSAGYYVPGLRNLVFCGDPRIRSEAALKFIARHELFHAVQFAYPNVAADPARAAWFIEGTATAAAAWDGTMNRANLLDLRTVGISLMWEDDLMSEDDRLRKPPYEAQDYWVHLFTSTSPESGFRRALPLGQLTSFLERGASTQAVAAEMEASSSFEPLAEEYWAWSKNQVYEKTDVTFAGALSPPCELGLGALLAARYVVNDGSGANTLWSFIDEPLKSTSVFVHFPAGAAKVTVGAAGDEGLRYEIYLRGEAGCWSRPSNVPREFYDLPEGSSVFVLLANTRHEAGTIRFEVTVSPGE
jgi:hypothetical protein